LPKLLRNNSPGFRYNPLFVLKNLGWFIKFLSYCTKRHAHHAGRALRGLMQISLDRHRVLIKEAKVEEVFRHQGWFKVFRDQKTFEKFRAEQDLLDETGVHYTVYDREQIRQIEPGLSPIYEKGVLLDETCGVSNPAKLTDAYLKLFLDAGGHVVEDAVSGFIPHEGWDVTLARGDIIKADQIVLAAGPWSAELASWLGYDIPLKWERGYHRHLTPSDGPALNRAVHDVDGGFAMAPMQTGVRITTGVEMTDRDAAPNFTQLDAAISDARSNHHFGDAVDDEPWMGCRPTLVDSLPMIGVAPRHEGLFFNFGHQHIGLSTGPGSGQIIAALLKGEKPPIDISPFRPERFRI
jgi:D-amino-acid dehydrogenase